MSIQTSVRASHIIQINSSTTLNNLYDTYIVDGSVGVFTITLPSITANGYNYLLRRTDNTTNVITIIGTGGQLIDGITSITLRPKADTYIHSLNNQWYTVITEGTEDVRISLHIDGYKDITNTTYTGDFARFIYKGSNYYGGPPVIMKMSYNLSSGTTSRSFSVRLVNLSVVPNQQIAEITAIATTNSTTYLTSSTTTFTNVPTTESVIDIQARLLTSGTPVRLNTVYVRSS